MYSYPSLYLGTPCDEDGNDLPPGTPPPPPSPPPVDENGDSLPYFPYRDCEEFKLANFLFKRNQMPGTEIDELMQIWVNTLPEGQDPPFADHKELYDTIDATILGDAPWQSFSITYAGDLPVHGSIPPWMRAHDARVVEGVSTTHVHSSRSNRKTQHGPILVNRNRCLYGPMETCCVNSRIGPLVTL